MHPSSSIASLVLAGLVLVPSPSAGGTSAGSTLLVPSVFPTVESAVAAAVDGDTVLVAPGIYLENDIFINGKKIHIVSSGGPGVTTLDGDGKGRIFRFNGGETLSTVLEGFTLRDGQAPTGGGTAGDGGGAILFQESDPWIKNCVFASCRADGGTAAPGLGGTGYRGGHGGAVYLYNSDVRFESCTFQSNRAGRGGDGRGGAAGGQGSFFSPTGEPGGRGGNGGRGGHGGAAYVQGNSASVFVNCHFLFNDAGTGGRGAPGGPGGPAYLDLLFGFTGKGGRGGDGGNGGQGGEGGAVYADSGTQVELVNCTLVSQDLAPGGTRGFGTAGGPGTSTGATGNDGLTGARATVSTVFASGSASVVMRNGIVWDNDVPGLSNTVDTAFCVLGDTSGTGGVGTLVADPLLETSNGTALTASSPCIDAGMASAVPVWATTDIVGEPRFVDDPLVPDIGFGTPAFVDIGANELVAAYALPYGCGVNPVGSLSVLAGTPSLGATVTFGIDNPFGSQPAGALPVLLYSLQPPVQPCGVLVPGFGMAGGGASGALLLGADLDGFVGSPWAGTGSPAPMDAPVPDVAALLGVSIYCQGALVGGGIGLTDAIQLIVGP